MVQVTCLHGEGFASFRLHSDLLPGSRLPTWLPCSRLQLPNKYILREYLLETYGLREKLYYQEGEEEREFNRGTPDRSNGTPLDISNNIYFL